jgi:hypothetical protein
MCVQQASLVFKEKLVNTIKKTRKVVTMMKQEFKTIRNAD